MEVLTSVPPVGSKPWPQTQEARASARRPWLRLRTAAETAPLAGHRAGTREAKYRTRQRHGKDALGGGADERLFAQLRPVASPTRPPGRLPACFPRAQLLLNMYEVPDIITSILPNALRYFFTSGSPSFQPVGRMMAITSQSVMPVPYSAVASTWLTARSTSPRARRYGSATSLCNSPDIQSFTSCTPF